ncbi:MAG TPA: GNAT family N-acetyltransferase [Caulobacteraceae bacterium]
MIIRPALEGDAAAIADIYGDHVLHGLGTFEEQPPSAGEILARMGAIRGLQLPYLLAEESGAAMGFAYAAPFRPRAAYRYTVEDSVYMAPRAMGRGVGKALVAELIAVCEAMGLRQMMAVIGDSANQASIALHRSLGFEAAGRCRAVGYKMGRWVDTVWMQRALNGGDAAPPDVPGLALRGG